MEGVKSIVLLHMVGQILVEVKVLPVLIIFIGTKVGQTALVECRHLVPTKEVVMECGLRPASNLGGLVFLDMLPAGVLSKHGIQQGPNLLCVSGEGWVVWAHDFKSLILMMSSCVVP